MSASTAIVARQREQPLLASHPVYQYLAKRYGLNLQSVLWEPEVMPNDEQWDGLQSILETHAAAWMLWEGDPLPTSADKLQALGVKSCGLRPVREYAGTRRFSERHAAERGASPGSVPIAMWRRFVASPVIDARMVATSNLTLRTWLPYAQVFLNGGSIQGGRKQVLNRKSVMPYLVLSLVLLLSSARLAAAHDYWIEASNFWLQPGDRVLFYLRVGEYLSGQPAAFSLGAGHPLSY